MGRIKIWWDSGGWGGGGKSSRGKFFQVGGDEQILGWWEGETLLPLPQVVKTLHIYNICIYLYIYIIIGEAIQNWL